MATVCIPGHIDLCLIHMLHRDSLRLVFFFIFIYLCSLRLAIFVVDLSDCHFASNDATLLRIVNCVQSCFPSSSMLPIIIDRLRFSLFLSFCFINFMFALPQTISRQRNNKLMANDKESVMCIHQIRQQFQNE